jgi:hypothetical protein
MILDIVATASLDQNAKEQAGLSGMTGMASCREPRQGSFRQHRKINGRLGLMRG